jgi:hypothetical protein
MIGNLVAKVATQCRAERLICMPLRAWSDGQPTLGSAE